MSRLVNNSVLVSLPILSGLQSVIWARLIKTSAELVMVANIATYAIAGLIFVLLRHSGNGLPVTSGSDPKFALIFVAYVVNNVICTLLWAKGIQTSNIVIIGAMEIAYPIFILLFSFLIFGHSITLNAYHYLGGLAIMTGSALVIYGNSIK